MMRWVEELRAQVKRFGAQAPVARFLGFGQQFLSTLLSGQYEGSYVSMGRALGPKIRDLARHSMIEKSVCPKSRYRRPEMWKAMRAMRVFTVPDLMMTSMASKKAVQLYLFLLRRAGIVVTVGRTVRPGNPGRCAVYRLLVDSGPHHPILTQDPVKTSPRGRWRRGE